MLKRTLSIKLALHIIIATLSFAIIISMVITYFEFQSYKKNVFLSVNELLLSTENTASEALYKLDRNIAQSLVDGIVANKYIIQSTLFDENNVILASKQESFDSNVWRPLGLKNETINTVISIPNQDVFGALETVIDMEKSLASFYSSTTQSIILEFIQIIAISLIVYLVSVYLVTKPVERLSRTIEKITPGEKAPEIDLNKYEGEIGLLARNTINFINESYNFAQQLKVKQKERLLLEERLQHSNKMDAMGQLAGGIAHDFNNMLTIIMSAAQMLELTNKKSDDKSMKYISMIIDTSERAADLTSKLLSFGRKGAISTATIDMHKIIDDTALIFNQTINKNISIHIEKTAEKHLIKGQLSSLQSALMNLGINASHAMPNGGELHIQSKNVTLSQANCDNSNDDLHYGDYIEIKIRDTGSGIESEVLKNIYDPFFTTKGLGKGTGLGLTEVYGCIQEHKGSITVATELGVGTEFTLLFPCTYEPLLKNTSEQPSIIGSGELILVIDDEADIRETLVQLLIERGFQVITADDGSVGLNLYKEHHKDIKLVLLDMIMPSMDGYDTFFKMQEINDHCKVILISGFYDDNRVKVLLDSGLVGVLQKPYKKQQLFEMISLILNA